MVFSQPTITIEDLQYEIGGYYKMYNIPSPQGVIGLTGNQGGPHIFDFSEGVTSDSLIIDYVDVNDGGHGGDFTNATIAERITNENGFAWMYLDFLAGTGRKNFGFYDEIGVPDSPSVPFSPPIIDFPDNLSYQSYFSGTTNFDVFMSGLDINIEYEFSGFADAYGTVILPNGLGEHECIQINYEEQYTYYWMGTPIQYSYLRSYYYLAEDLGIVAIITSLEEENPVPNGFNIANTFARMYDSSKITVSMDNNLICHTVALSNYPNPFNPATTINYQIPSLGFVEMFIYDINGKLIETLVNQNQQQGTQSVLWHSKNMSSGIYFYQLKLNGEILQTKQAILLK